MWPWEGVYYVCVCGHYQGCGSIVGGHYQGCGSIAGGHYQGCGSIVMRYIQCRRRWFVIRVQTYMCDATIICTPAFVCACVCVCV